MDNIMSTESDREAEEEELVHIASRTRSHVRIEDFEENDNLNLPDVDPSMYHNPDSDGDPEYKKFLTQTYSSEINNPVDTNTEDTDPNYVYNDDIFSHGWRFDVFEGIELNQNHRILDASCSSIDNSNKVNSETNEFGPPQQSLSALLSGGEENQFKGFGSSRINKRKTDLFSDPQFKRILNQQLRQHIQLLTQTYLLTRNSTIMRNEADEAKIHLDSYIKIFENRRKPSNLLPAMKIIDNFITPKEIKSSIRLSWRQLPVPESVRKVMDENRNVFIYPSLKPQATFSILPEKLLPKKPKINFTINEDKLLAYALNEFKNESSPYAFIASLLMTAKTKTQISNHIKNIKRSKCDEDNPIKLYYADGQLPVIDLDGDADLTEPIKKQEEGGQKAEERAFKKENKDPVAIQDNREQYVREVKLISDKRPPTPPPPPQPQPQQQEPAPVPTVDNQLIETAELQMINKESINNSPSNNVYQDQDDLMNMDLDDLMAASTTISKTATTGATSNNENNKNIRNLKLKKSMLNLMSHNFSLSSEMGDLIVYEFLKTAEQKLGEKNYHKLLQILNDLLSKKHHVNGTDVDNAVVSIYQEICKFLIEINAPFELLDRCVLFLNLNQATKCSSAFSYLHWIRFFQFIQHVELYNDGVEALEKKLARLVDALQKDDSHKIKLAVGNLINKHPFLKMEFDSLSLEEVPHPSLFICEEDFDDITEPIAMFDVNNDTTVKLENSELLNFEHFSPKISKEELSFASQACPCKCHIESSASVEGRMGQHCNKCNLKFMKGRMYLVSKIKPILAEWAYTGRSPEKVTKMASCNDFVATIEWTMDEDRTILEFCRTKAEQNEETLSFDTTTFEELVHKREGDSLNYGGGLKKNAKQIAERFNQLMDLYKDENSNNIQ